MVASEGHFEDLLPGHGPSSIWDPVSGPLLPIRNESFPPEIRSSRMKEKFELKTILDIHDLERLRAAGSSALLVDVRSASEYSTGHIPGAINMPLEQLESRVEDLGKGL